MDDAPKVGKKYDIKHSRKGNWQAKLVEIQGEGTDDVWYVFSDDTSSPVRARFTTLKEIK